MVSVIITVHNYQQYIERAIRSALDQSLAKDQYEDLVVNDASTDYTRKILENYEDDVRIIHLDENVGLAAARNLGIKKAKGQYVVFLDADDYMHKHQLLIQVMHLAEHDALDAVSVDYYLVNERGTHLEHVNAEKNPIACGIMFRKDLLFEIGLYDESFKAREEEELRNRFLQKYKIHNIILPLYRYRMHKQNLTKNVTLMDEYAEKLKQKIQG
jgi:glycosyltransferase involved in cell wall biosynthesis